MNTTTTLSTAPDYGEPWKMEAYNSPLGESGDFEGVIEIRTCDEIRRVEAYNPDDEDEDAFKRVNACAGMADPAKEIEAMREAVQGGLCRHHQPESRRAASSPEGASKFIPSQPGS